MLKTKTHGKKLDQLIVGSGLITIDQLNEAFQIQEVTGVKLGKILLSMGVITPEELQMFLEFQESGKE
jgi:hypothetical protein